MDFSKYTIDLVLQVLFVHMRRSKKRNTEAGGSGGDGHSCLFLSDTVLGYPFRKGG